MVRLRLPLMWWLVACGLVGRSLGSDIPTRIQVRRAFQLAGEPLNENLATQNQAMNVWRQGAGEGKELVVAQIVQFRDTSRRADDIQYAVVWESDGENMTEVRRVPMSCPDVDLVVPSRGPFAYETRLTGSPYSLHPECACQPSVSRACPPGVQAVSGQTGLNFSSPIESHFVGLENEWQQPISGQAVLDQLEAYVDAPVTAVSQRVVNASQMASQDASRACPGSRDELVGGPEVTTAALNASGMKLPDGHVEGRWCLVQRGGCSETSKVKVCELSGAVGTIIVDHGNFQGDQDITIRYNLAAGEGASRPVLFLSEADGQQLMAAAATPSGVSVRVGPNVSGPPPPGYHPGSGLIVHRLASDPNGTVPSKAYPDLFPAAGWAEVSDVRDLLFVCRPDLGEIQIFDVSSPLSDIPRVGKITARCLRSGKHDYRILDYMGPVGRYVTALVDPADWGNRLYYYDTHDISAPRLLNALHLTWEAENDGLGQVRPGGPEGRYHFVTWHCSNLMCGKNHGDHLYIMDTQDLTAPARSIALPMPTVGTFARDLACGSDHLCLVTLTWDGLVAVDSGTAGTVNQFLPIARFSENQPFGSSNIPVHLNHLRQWSGAQKVYASKVFSRRFYVEHADFNLQPLYVGDVAKALQLKDIYIAEITGYNPSVRIPGYEVETVGTEDEGEGLSGGMVAMIVFAVICVLVLMALMVLLIRARTRSSRLQMEMSQIREAGRASAGPNVVVGRPVEGSAAAGAAAAGNPVQAPEEAKAQELPAAGAASSSTAEQEADEAQSSTLMRL